MPILCLNLSGMMAASRFGAGTSGCTGCAGLAAAGAGLGHRHQATAGAFEYIRNQEPPAPNTSTLHQSGKYPSRIKKSSI